MTCFLYLFSVKSEVIYIIGGRLVWEMQRYLSNRLEDATALPFFPQGVAVHLFGYDELSVKQAGAVVNGDQLDDHPPPTIVIFALGAQELREVGDGDIQQLVMDLSGLATMVKCKYRKAPVELQCFLLGPSKKPYWGVEHLDDPRAFLGKLLDNREALMRDMRPPVMYVIRPVDLTPKMRECFDIILGKPARENYLAAQVLLRRSFMISGE